METYAEVNLPGLRASQLVDFIYRFKRVNKKQDVYFHLRTQRLHLLWSLKLNCFLSTFSFGKEFENLHFALLVRVTPIYESLQQRSFFFMKQTEARTIQDSRNKNNQKYGKGVRAFLLHLHGLIKKRGNCSLNFSDGYI